MTPKRFDLAKFCLDLLPDEPTVQQVCRHISLDLYRPLRSVPDWPSILMDHRSKIDNLAGANDIGVGTASTAYFVADLLTASALRGSPVARNVVSQYVIMLGLTMSEWGSYVRDVAQQRGNHNDKSDFERPPVAMLSIEVLVTLHQQGQDDVIRLLYDEVRQRIDKARQAAQRQSSTYDEWLMHLAVLSIALAERKFTPITETPLGVGDWHPLAERVFTADELDPMRRQEAFYAEQFAHLFVVMTTGAYLPESLPRLPADMSTLDRAERREMRERLRLMRARYEIPPYLFNQLDQRLSEVSTQ